MITFGTTQLGIIRAEGVAFAVSPRNSALAVAHLLTKTSAKHLLVTEDLKSLANAAIDSMSHPSLVVSMPSFYKDLFLDKDEIFETLPPAKHKEIHDPVAILHSSGKAFLFVKTLLRS